MNRDSQSPSGETNLVTGKIVSVKYLFYCLRRPFVQGTCEMSNFLDDYEAILGAKNLFAPHGRRNGYDHFD